MKTTTRAAGAQAAGLNFLLAAVEGDGDLTSFLAWADWLEEQGSEKRAARVRKDALKYAADPGRTVCGHTWLRWHAAYELGLTANALARSETTFPAFAYHGNYNADGTMSRDDGSMEYALTHGYAPTLRRSRKRQANLGRVIEGLGYRVFYRNREKVV